MAYERNARRTSKEYDDANRLALWENDRARAGKRDPEFKGSATEVECPCCGKSSDYWVSLWENSNGGGSSPMYSGKIEPKDADGRTPSRTSDRRDDDRPPLRSRRDDREREREREPRYSNRRDPRDEPPPRDRYDGPGDPDEEIPF